MRPDIGDRIVALAAGCFLLVYGLGLLGWPFDATRGIRALERMNRSLRVLIAAAMMAAGLFGIAIAIGWRAGRG